MTADPEKFLYVINHMDWFWSHRLPLALGARDQGWDVHIAAHGANTDAGLANFQLQGDDLPNPKGRFAAVTALKIIWAILQHIRRLRPKRLHAITIKYVFLAGIAARFFPDLKCVFTIAGLGYLFSGDSLKARILRIGIAPVLRLVLLNPNAQVIVQNPDDRDILVAQNFVRPDHCHVILGSGVDLQQFPSSELPVTDTPVILMPTRLVRDKGISVFVEAAKILRAKNIHVRCVIAGGITEHNPMALSIQEMQDFCADGAVTWLGKVTDMQTLYAQAHMIVYPSHYGEGIPKVLLEAAASGRAIITTDHPGCREVVQHHDNGLLVPVRDAASVAAGIEELLSDPNRLKDMGHASRKRAEKLFDVRDIVAQTLAIYDL